MNKRSSALTPLSLGALIATFTFFSVVAAQAEGRPTLTPHVPEAVSSGVAPLVGHVPATQRLSLAVSLPLRNEAALDELLQQIYDPQSPNYHKYLSVEEFTTRFGPVAADYAAVVNFARANGLQIIDTAANRMVLDIEGPAASIENAFHVTLNIYQHPTEGRTFYAPDREPSVDLDVPLLHISGLDNYTLPQAKNIRGAKTSRKTTGSGPGGDFVGSDLRAAYYGSGSLDGSGQAVGLFELAGYEVSDVQNYFNKLKQPLEVPINGVSVNGASLKCPPSSCDDSEQALDIEISISMAPRLEQVLVYVGKSDVSIFDRMAVDNKAKQLSCSWGWSDDESSLDPIFKEMAAQGQTVFVATGDNGSGTPGDVVWPGDDPYILAVGGTDLVTTGPGGAWLSETGWNGSAGSPSKNGIPIPYYQKLKGVVNSENGASSTLRNYPDVAAEANTNQWSCYDGACYGGNGGTSYAAPQWAGITAMANQLAYEDGMGALGFLNPNIYRIGVGSDYDTDFHDITSGSNGKYSAVTGYDLVTGWGSPQAANLVDELVFLKY
ncbi:MAG TPA: protease pro-enzyme activation domain-containing protein [Candidatus Aquilonibacter sp.]|nr:protease pro-enzyme activation domain-containing protein [Candidatus Aquilonibacter sp.]